MTANVRLRAVASSVRVLAPGVNLPYVALEHVASGTGTFVPGFEPELKPANAEVAFCRGDVLFGKLRPYLAKVLEPEFDGAASGEFLVLRPRSQLRARYLYYLCLSHPFLEWAEATSVGTKMPRTDWDALSAYRLQLPSPERQKEIADFLDRETARIDVAISAKLQLLDLMHEKWIATVSLATDNPAWPQIRLKWALARPLEYGIGEPALFDEPSWPRYIRTTDVSPNGDLRKETFKSLPPEVARPYLLSDGDLLFTRSGATVGKTFLYRKEWGASCFAGYLIRAKADRSKALPQFLSFFAQSQAYWSQIKLLTLQATIQNVSAERYADLLVRLPTVQEQERIIADLRYLEERVAELRWLLTNQIALLREHRQTLVTARVTGQVDA